MKKEITVIKISNKNINGHFKASLRQVGMKMPKVANKIRLRRKIRERLVSSEKKGKRGISQ